MSSAMTKPVDQSFSRLIAETRQHLINCQDDPPALKLAIKDCGSNIRSLQSLLKSKANIGKKQQITNTLCMLQGFRAQMKALRSITGAGYKPANPNRANYRSLRVKWVDVDSAFASRLRTGCVVNLEHKDPNEFLSDANDVLRRKIQSLLKQSSLKVNATFCGEFKVIKQNEEFFELKYMKSKNAPIHLNTDFVSWFDNNVRQPILKELEEFQERDSGWALDAIVNITFNINKFTPLIGSSYIKLPAKIQVKEACVNVKNDDDSCFAWAVVSALYPVKHGQHPDRVSSYPHYSSVLNLQNISIPMTLKQIPRFESQNDISINVYILEKQKKNFTVVPTYLTKYKQAKHVNLLLIQDVYTNEKHEEDVIYEDSDNYKPRYHYVWIKNLSRLVGSQVSRMRCKKYFCDRCLHYFYSQNRLNVHLIDCINMNDCKVRLPKEGEKVTFKNQKNKEKTPFIVYADLECILKPENDNSLMAIKTRINYVQKHEPYSAGYYVKCAYDDSLSFYRSYRGENCQQWFAQEMKQLAEDVETVFLCSLPMEPLTLEQELEFQSISHCHICEQAFDIRDRRVRDHCHLTGKYRGAAHEDCNINYQDSHIIPVVFHNLSGYDAHFIIKNVAKDFEGRVDLLPINKERYISFTKNIKENLIKFRFIDSFKFLASGLETLASHLTEYPELKSQFPTLTEDEFQLLTRKGVFPYDFIDSYSRLDETKIPDQTKFFNSMTDTHITDSDYAHANNVWNSFNCKNLGEYSDLYLKTDVLLLADVFEKFRQSCLKRYGLDPAHYYTLPGYTWDCMLKYTQINLELLTDIDMILFIERGIRGGLSQCSKRYSKANNKYMSNYDSTKPSLYLIYDDINNQYGWAMSQYLPYGGFEWVEGDLNNFNFNIPADHPEGYILEVDLEYPEEIHDSHSDLPFCPEHRAPPNSKEQKLMATLYNKERYVIHYRNLQQCLEKGLKLTKIHRVLKFNQSSWLKKYIDLNTKLRTSACNDFEKNLFKLMNNAVFGKTMENIRKHSIVKLVTKWEGRYGAEALIAKPNFKSSTIFAENLTAIELNKTEIYFNKPIYVGMCILDISKIKIYDFHYHYMKSRFGDKARVCYTDTDSLIYEVETDDLYEVIRCDAQNYFDTSDYPDNNIYNIPRVNKKVVGMMKDENCGKVMTEFVGLRSKMYALRVEGDDLIKRAKGVKRHIVKNRLTFDDYVNCLKEDKETLIQQKMFKSVNHQVSTIQQTKVALNRDDDKRYIIPDTADTLPWGHHTIMST